jgi:equilibrative nucleoside transporter 1/2/3
VRALFRPIRPSQEYERIDDDDDEEVRRPVLIVPDKFGEEPFSWFEYSIFVMLGIAMLWAWYIATLLCCCGSANTLAGICSSQQLPTSKRDFKTTRTF